ncbi:quinol monooxygenase YgiN [Lactobacillus colini]|uniref:Quinol monooxygenase YgiN n=1 Tax=Lactobacillus colini TaxID=1819254 RepID=A0ABS4MGR1_9LACO|nr:antibiotic biosynthesis monooxygenase [Lactobacillus colini]MBP2058884.1 quinol monooxygenase YgiN [Lactobacillus colini]
MYLQFVTNKVKDKEKYISAAKIFVQDLIKVNGCISADVYQVEGKNNEVVIASQWINKDRMYSTEAEATFLNNKHNLKTYFISNETTILVN